MPAVDWVAITNTLWIRSCGRCERCGNRLPDPDDCERHHRRPRSGGGLHVLANLLLLCHTCHPWVHSHPKDSMKAGWIVSRYGPQPEDVPVDHGYHGRVFLTPDGGTSTLVPLPLSRDLPPMEGVVWP